MKNYIIETKNLTKVYGEQKVVNSVNLHMEKGSIYGLLGRNGAGKTTIMKMILGLTDITNGEVSVFNQNIKGNEKKIYPRIGAIIETPGFYPNLTGTEILEIFALLRGTAFPDAVKNALEVVCLPYKDKKPFGNYSLRMKQRLGIANAILHDPEVLILDESNMITAKMVITLLMELMPCSLIKITDSAIVFKLCLVAQYS